MHVEARSVVSATGALHKAVAVPAASSKTRAEPAVHPSVLRPRFAPSSCAASNGMSSERSRVRRHGALPGGSSATLPMSAGSARATMVCNVTLSVAPARSIQLTVTVTRRSRSAVPGVTRQARA